MSLRVHQYTVAAYIQMLERQFREAEAQLAESWGALYFSDRRYFPLMSMGGEKI